MADLRERISLAVSLFIVWLLLNGSLAWEVMAVGLVVSIAIPLLFPANFGIAHGLRFHPRALYATAGYFAYFAKELVKSNFALARIVVSPDLPVTPGIVKVRTRLKSPIARLLLANSITLTPGTLTVEVEGEWLYVHWVTVEAADVEGATQRIVAGFERYIEVMYG